MIRSVSEILKNIIKEEKEVLDNYNIKHAPTIGDMYEGLTREILELILPKDLFMKKGFIHDGQGNQSGQIDCMLVYGEGENIPFTDSFIWHIKDVIAVFEVKKSISKPDIDDAFAHLQQITELHYNYTQSGSNDIFNVGSAIKAFSQISGYKAPKRDELKYYPLHIQYLYHSLIVEAVSPICIILGYDGYAKEVTLRSALLKILENNLFNKGYGVNSFPQLIICGDYSLIKLNGQPYSAGMEGDYWQFYASSRSNPIHLILELILTRLSRRFDFTINWGDDLESEILNPLLSGKVVAQDGKIGWKYLTHKIEHSYLSKEQKEVDWEPVSLTDVQYAVITNIYKNGSEKIDNSELVNYLIENGEEKEKFVEEIIKTGLICRKGNELYFIGNEFATVFTPDGKCLATSESQQRLSNYVAKKYPDKFK